MRHRGTRRAAAILTTVFLAGCAGGSSCAGVTPLPEGFKLEERIENAGSVRITSSGLGYLEKEVGGFASSLLGLDATGGVLSVEIPTSTQGGVTVCPGGSDPLASPPRCVTEIDFGAAALSLDAALPSSLSLTGTLPFRMQDLPIELTPSGSETLTLNGNGACPPAAQDYAAIAGSIGISIEVNTKTAKLGYSRGRVAELSLDKQALKDSLSFCNGSGMVLDDALVDLLHNAVLGEVRASLEKVICQAADTLMNPPCPKGTNNVNGICRYGTTAADECVAALLGSEGRVDLGAQLASFAPGTRSKFDFLFALGGAGLRPDGSGKAYGDLNPVDQGATLGLYGGLEAAPASGCVPLSTLEAPKDIPVPDELLGNTVEGWPAGVEGPHAGVALSERFVNYALSGMYNSGLLCIAVSTSAVDLLSSGTLSLVANSIKDLGLQQEGQPIAVVLRPSSPPHVELGNGTNLEDDPLLRVTLQKASLDMYIWSLDRFIRFLTVTLDLDAPVNLTVTPDGLQPVLSKIEIGSIAVTNSELIREDPAKIAEALKDLIGGLVGQALGSSIAPININDLLLSGLGLSLMIPETETGKGSPGLRKLTKGSDDFLGIFGSIELVKGSPPAPPPSPPTPPSPGARAKIVLKEVDPSGVRLPTMTPSNAPVVRLEMAAAADGGARAIERAYRVDNGLWRPFTRERVVTVDDPWLRLQGRHTIEVRSRFAGEAMSLDPAPASVEVLIDVEPPSVAIREAAGGKVAIAVRDFVSGAERTLVRTRLDQGAWSAWSKASPEVLVDVGGAAAIEVEAQDEEGNIATAAQAIIRGGAAVSDAGCGCVAAGEDREASSWAAFFGAAIAAVARACGRRKRARK